MGFGGGGGGSSMKWKSQISFVTSLDELPLFSWRNSGRPATPGKVCHFSKCALFRGNDSHWGSLESQNL